MDIKTVEKQAHEAVCELIDKAGAKAGDLLVTGCSSSEIVGGTIGHASSPEAAKAVFDIIYGELSARGIFLAAQCCEHLNRALVLEREAAKTFGGRMVNAVPQVKAGGSFATAAYQALKDPVLCESVQAVCGLDIGETLIGMHIMPVCVPLRLTTRFIGEARVTAAKSRLPYIGGARAVYQEGV